jgi:TPR repeat protein
MNDAPTHPPRNADELAAITAERWKEILLGEPVRAVEWISAAAELGDAQAQTVLGQWLLDGRGVEKNSVQALAWFLSAAHLNHAMAMNMAGRCHENGWGTNPDADKAAHWFQQAAALGLPEGRYNLANMLVAGHGIKQNQSEAIALYRQAAEQGYAKAFGKLGHYYEEGLLIDRDLGAAKRCYQRAAEGGDFRGRFNLAGMLAAEGHRAEALEWLARVPETATPAFLREAGEVLLKLSDAEFQAMGRMMVERAEGR